jgi:hypothetical protein
MANLGWLEAAMSRTNRSRTGLVLLRPTGQGVL